MHILVLAIVLLRSHETNAIREVAEEPVETSPVAPVSEQAAAAKPAPFILKQYNILAGYLGKNEQPWFLYGAHLTRQKRAKIMEVFYSKDAGGNYLHNFDDRFDGLLSEKQAKAVEMGDREAFNFTTRRERIVTEMLRDKPDVMCLEELDEFDFFYGRLSKAGYEGLWHKRPRRSSLDGNAVFWNSERFRLLGNRSCELLDFKDKADLVEWYHRPDEVLQSEIKNQMRSDRIASLVALEDVVTKRKLLVVAVHLQRNPEDANQADHRNFEVQQLQHHIDSFSEDIGFTFYASSGVVPRDALVIAGDFNSDQSHHWDDDNDRSDRFVTYQPNSIGHLALHMHLPNDQDGHLSSVFELRDKCDAFKVVGDIDWEQHGSSPIDRGVGNHHNYDAMWGGDKPQLDWEATPQQLDRAGDWWEQPRAKSDGIEGAPGSKYPNDCCTTKTEARTMWIDHILYTCQSLQVTELYKDPCPAMKLPDLHNPSDHMPVAVKFEWRPIDTSGFLVDPVEHLKYRVNICAPDNRQLRRFADPRP